MNERYPSLHPDLPASQIFRAKDVRKSGMLRKKAGGFKFTPLQDPYDHRFFIIHKGWVYYYKNEKSEKPQGKFSLEEYSSNVVNAEEEEARMQHVFKVYGKSADTRIWYFAAENEMEKREWMEAFRLEIEQYKFAGSGIKGSSSSPYPRSGETHTSVNERPKSINIPNGAFQQENRRPLTNFPSSATIDSGFRSTDSSLCPEYDYEPVRQQRFTSDPTKHHSADVSHTWDTSQHFIKTRPPEPLPQTTLNAARGVSGGYPDDVPQRPPPRPPRNEHQDITSNSQQAVGLTQQKSDFHRSNLPHHPGSPPFGFAAHNQNFSLHYAKDSTMRQFHLPPTISNHADMHSVELEQYPEYCDMDIHDEQPSHEITQPKKTFTRHPPMPPMNEPSADQKTIKSRREFQAPSAHSPSSYFVSPTQAPGSPSTQLAKSHVRPRDMPGDKPSFLKPPTPPLKPVLPHKPKQLVPGKQGKPLTPAKPAHLHGGHQTGGGVKSLRAAFESN